MTQKITTILLCLIMFLGGGITGYVVKNDNKKSDASYEETYKNFDSFTTTEKLAIFNASLKAETAPSEIKFLMNKIINDTDITTQNEILAKYMNHIQYHMSTYSNLMMYYQAIMKNMQNSVDFTNPSAANQISDKVLKTIVSEIYESDMMIIMPSAQMKDAIPYILVDYDKIASKYGKIMNQATIDYIAFKEIAQSGGLSSETGEYDMDRIGDYIIKANEFIVNHTSYPLVADVINSYILGSKMYLNIYNFSGTYDIDDETINKYKTFLKENPNTPISLALEEIISLYEKNQPVTIEHVNTWIKNLEGLLG